MFCEVVVPRTPLDELTYRFEPADCAAPEPGDLMAVRLRNREVVAVVLKTGEECPIPDRQIQPVLKILARQVVPRQLLTLARWVADYYVCHLGEVMGLVVPSDVRKKFIHRKTQRRGSAADSLIKERTTVKEPTEIIQLPSGLSRAITEGSFGVWVAMNEDNSNIIMNRFIFQALGCGSVLVLMPEPELKHWLPVLRSRLGEQLVEYHNRLTPKQRQNAWLSLLSRDNKVIVGMRSAVWTPVQKLAGVLVLAEHSPAFKEERRPGYNARDVAITRAKIARCPVLLIDSTPSSETWWNIQNHRFTMLERLKPIPIRKGVFVVDMRLHKEEVISPRLDRELKRTLKQGKTALGYINRQGLSRFVVCAECGAVLRCSHCRLPAILTGDARLSCRLCGLDTPAPDQCPVCQSGNFRFRAPGVEMVVRKLRELGIASKLFKAEDNAAQVLVGTRQMLREATGHSALTAAKAPGLIALIDFDTEFALPDFRNREKAFALLCWILRRARRDQAQVVIQTYRPDDPVLDFALAGDVRGFMTYELKMRQEAGFPPFNRLVAINITGDNEKTVKAECEALATQFKGMAGIEMLGPLFTPLRSNECRARIILKLPRDVLPGRMIDLNWLQRPKVRVRVDVDPLKIL
ncbi:MAG: replication restart helicase PriA [bacterium]